MQHIIIGIPLPERVKKYLFLHCFGLSNARWIESERLHLSLIDAGKRSGTQILDIIHVLQGATLPPFEITLQGIASLPSNHGLHIIGALATISPSLNKLKNLIQTLFREEKIPIELKPFHPHVPLGILHPGNTTKTAQYFFENQSKPLQTFKASSFALFETRLSEKHSLCEMVAEFPLTQTL